jgi:uncharacterized protein with ParB-like and HNH nuclease domain
MQAQDMPFSKVIDADQGARDHFHVPKYQREYAWGRKEWEQILLDIEENDPGYFMGSLICVKDGSDSAPGWELIYDVVDGQQRLTTLSLLLMAIYMKLMGKLDGHIFEDVDEKKETEATLRSLEAKLIKRKKEPSPVEPGGISVGKKVYFLRVQPSAQNHNLEDYRYVLCEVGLLEGQQKPAYCGNRRMYQAFAYFSQELSKDRPQEGSTDTAPMGVSDLCNLVTKINRLIFVQITVESQADAYTLFESLNNRGIPLTPIDIIKNKLLAAMDRQHHVDIDDSFERWQAIINALPDVAEQERFLRHFYNAFKHVDQIRVEGITRATKSQIIRIYESLIKRDAQIAFAELTEKAALYGTLLRPPEHLAAPLARNLEELQRIGAASAYQILLFLFSLPKEKLQGESFLENAVSLLCRYHIRRNITDIPATRDLDPGAIELIEGCVTEMDEIGHLKLETFTHLLLSGRGQPASLHQLRSALEGPIYENTGMARYLLIQLDLMHHTREYQPELWARDEKGRFVWTIEHVLPQSEKLPAHWVQMIAAGDPDKAAAVQEKFVNCLGNLTLSGYNSDLATSAFEKKQQLARDRTFLGHKINIGYRNGLALNNLPFEIDENILALATATKWSSEMIEARTGAMVNLLIEVNKLPGEESLSSSLFAKSGFGDCV